MNCAKLVVSFNPWIRGSAAPRQCKRKATHGDYCWQHKVYQLEISDGASETQRKLLGDIMKRICAWHPNNFGVELIIEDGTLPATHGICHLCATIEGERVNQQRLDSNARFAQSEGAPVSHPETIAQRRKRHATPEWIARDARQTGYLTDKDIGIADDLQWQALRVIAEDRREALANGEGGNAET